MRTKFYKLSTIFIMLFLCNNMLYAQQPIKRAELVIEPKIEFVFNQPGDTTTIEKTVYKSTVVIYLNDTVNISKIHVKVGSQLGAADLYPLTYFNYDESINLVNKTYLRQGALLYLGIGELTQESNCFAEITVEDISGSLFTPILIMEN